MLIGVDVGGTFTDLVMADEAGTLRFVKSPSTPDDPSRGVVEALVLMAEERGEDLETLLSQVTIFIHGTTVATNILVQRRGAKLGLITTRGFRDLLELRDGSRASRYALRTPPPEPIVPRPLRLEVAERVRADGSVEEALAEPDVETAIAALREADVEGVVVCLLHSHRNPEHERRIADAIERSGWSPYVSVSHAVLGREGEYDRLSTAAVNAYVGPGLKAYLGRLSGTLKQRGISVPVFVMQSTGGVLPIEAAGEYAVGAVTSGPAGGAMSGALFSRTLGLPNLVTYDTGGTTTDICVIQDGVPVEKGQTDLADMRITAPAIEVNPIGIGGGSLARIDASGILAIGPQSAGAVPGPACFGRGGTHATLTDANLVLGLISPTNFLGGRMQLDEAAARCAIQADVAAPLGITVEEAAWALHVLASSGITEGIRLATVRRGQDPRDVALMSFGGAGGLHASAVARELRIPKAIVPRMASVLSAVGFLAADIRHDLQRTVDRPIRSFSTGELNAIYADLEREGRERLAASGVETQHISVEYGAECRYARQVHSIAVSLGAGRDPAGLEAAFESAYHRLYRHTHPSEPGILDTCRVSVFGLLPKIALPQEEAVSSDPGAARRETRRIYAGSFMDAEVFDFDRLANGMRVSGPAIVESSSTTVFLEPGSTGEVDATGSLIIQRSMA